MKTLEQLLIIFLFSIVGDLISSILPFPLPGSIIGLVLLYIALKTKLIETQQIDDSAQWLKSNMAILFVPLSVGIMNYFDILIDNALALVLIIIISTILTYISSAKISEQVIKKEAHHD